MSEPSEVVGLVLGTEDATPLEFWVAIAPGHNLQLDDVVALDRAIASGEKVTHYGIVGQVRARHEGAADPGGAGDVRAAASWQRGAQGHRRGT